MLPLFLLHCLLLVGSDFLDFTAGGGTTITLTATGSMQVTFALVDDNIPEDTENLQAILSFAGDSQLNVLLSPSAATVTIFDNDNGGGCVLREGSKVKVRGMGESLGSCPMEENSRVKKY